LIPVHPMRLHRRDFVSTTSPTHRSGACETWVPMGPHRPGSQRSPSSGPDLPEALSNCKWAQRSYPQSRRPRKTLDDLIQIAEDLPGFGARFSLDHGGGAASRFEDCRILSVITEGDLPKSVTDPDEGPPTSNGNPSPPAI
jgi:hypothetical protein